MYLLSLKMNFPEIESRPLRFRAQKSQQGQNSTFPGRFWRQGTWWTGKSGAWDSLASDKPEN